MSELIAKGGNWLTAGSWGVVDEGLGSNQPSIISNALTSTGYTYCAAFTVTNGATIDGVLLMLSKAAGATGTFSVGISNDNGTSNLQTVTVNCSDIHGDTGVPGLMFFKFPATVSGDGLNNWKIGVKSSVGNAVTVWRSTATGNDWFHKLRTTTTRAPIGGGGSAFTAGTLSNSLMGGDLTMVGPVNTTVYGYNTGFNQTYKSIIAATFNATSAGATIARVNIATGTQSASSTTVATTATSLTAGNLSIVAVRGFTSSATVTGLADTAGNSYFFIARVYDPAGNALELWYAKNTLGNGANIVTATYSSAITFKSIESTQFSGCDTANPYSGQSSVGATGPQSFSVTTGVINDTSTNKTLVFAVAQDNVGGLNWGFLTMGDNVNICAEWTGAGASTPVTVTMNESTATGYGFVNVGDGGTLDFSTAGNTTLRVCDSLTQRPKSTVTIGTAGSPIPRGTTAVLEFFQQTNDGWSMHFMLGATSVFKAYGQSRSAGKDVVGCRLNANAAAAATALSVDTDTGWKNGDVIAIATTTATGSQNEERTLNADATSGGLSVSAGLTNAHGGVDPIIAEVMLLTHNVKIRSTTSAFMFAIDVAAGATYEANWVEYQYCGYATVTRQGLYFRQGTSADKLQYTSFREGKSCAIFFAAAAHDGWYVKNTNIWKHAQSSNQCAFDVERSTTGGSWIIDNLWVFGHPTAQNSQVQIFLDDLKGTMTNIVYAGGNNAGSGLFLSDSVATGWVIDGLSVHAPTNGPGIYLANGIREGKIKNFKVWRCQQHGVRSSGAVGASNIMFETGKFFGNQFNVYLFTANEAWHRFRFKDVQFSGDTTSGSTYGIRVDGNGGYIAATDWVFENCTFGVASGIYTAHSTRDISIVNGGNALYVTMTFNNCILASATPIETDGTWIKGGYLAFQNWAQTAGSHRIYTPTGTIIYDTTTFAFPTLKLTPSSATRKLEQHASRNGTGFMIPIDSGQTAQISVNVQKDGTYNGNQPRLIMRANPSIGIAADTVLATGALGTGVWETLTGSSGAVTADGVIEVYVDCDGTAGNVYLSSLSVN